MRHRGSPNAVDACWKGTKCVTKGLYARAKEHGWAELTTCILCGDEFIPPQWVRPVRHNGKLAGNAHIACHEDVAFAAYVREQNARAPLNMREFDLPRKAFREE
jgi:hypothetical protein